MFSADATIEVKMKKRHLSFVFVGITVALAAASAFAQGGSFSDPNVDYRFDLPDAKWKMTGKPSSTNPNVEYVYGDRVDGHLEIRKLTVGKNSVLTDVVRYDEQKRQFLPGYVAGREEGFAGR